jgi:hypothetical protein
MHVSAHVVGQSPASELHQMLMAVSNGDRIKSRYPEVVFNGETMKVIAWLMGEFLGIYTT